MSQKMAVKLRSLRRTYRSENNNGAKVTVHRYDRTVENCFPTYGKNTRRKMNALAAKLEKL